MKRLIILLINFIIVAAVSLGVFYYANSATASSAAKSQEKFVDTTGILEEIASNYLQDSQNAADSMAALINGSEFTMESAIKMIQQMITLDHVSAQLVWLDRLSGLSSEAKASDPSNYAVDYSKSNLSGVLSNVLTEGTIHITHRYTDPQSGSYVVAFCSEIRLTDSDGTPKPALLLYVLPVSELEARWTFPTEYGDSTSVALIDTSGEYVIKPSDMKNEDFFSYIYSYNRGVVNENDLKAEMADSLNGSFTAANAVGEECYWAYSHLRNNPEWLLVAVIPSEILNVSGTDWTIPLLLIIALGLLFIVDLSYLYTERRKERNTQLAFATQASVIGALAENYSNVFVIHPETDRAEIIKLESYVTDGITRETKSFPLSQIVSNYVRDRVYPEDRQALLAELSSEKLIETFAEAEDTDYSYRILVDGEVHYFNMHNVRMSEPGEALRIVSGFRCIDAILEEQNKSRKMLEDALDAAQHANRAKTVFLSNMSHDIRTPMNAIIGFTSLAAAHLDNRELVKDYLGKIQVSSGHLLSLINDVLDMSRIESGKVKIEEKEVHLPDVLHDLRTIVQSDIKAHQQELFIDTMDIVNEDIICDKLRLNQVLLNLVSNAIKFTGPGGQISIKIVQHSDPSPDQAAYTFAVKDTGIGMSEEFLKHLYEPFTRAQTATVSGIQGTGLGLAITKNIVDMMGGTISVSSKEGVGTEFVVSLRFRKAGTLSAPGPIPELSGASALVVDDDMDCCISVCKMLSEIGMRPEWTSSGREAVVRTQYACDRSDPFAVYIADWLMPDVNGIETVRRIRRIIGEQKPIIVLTSYDWGDIEAEAREAGVTHFVSKPIFLSELRNVLAEPFSGTPAASEADASPEIPDFSGFKLLLVEDNELNREIAVDILEEAGFAVDTVEDGSYAVEKLRTARPKQYDAVLMDIQMPIMDGYEASRQIRQLPDPIVSQIPIIAMTANAFEEDKQLAFAAGMNGHVAKPIDVPKLMEALAQVLPTQK